MAPLGAVSVCGAAEDAPRAARSGAARYAPRRESTSASASCSSVSAAGEELELHARVVNPQFVRMLRAIGFDRRWARAEGAHLYDADGNRYLDWLGGFGMYNVGRNNPRVKAALLEALELDTPGKLALGVNPLGAILADELLRRAPASLGRVLFSSSGTEAIEAAIKIGRAATGRSRVVSVERGFHGLTLGALSASGDPAFSDRFQPLVPGFSRVPFGDLDALEAELAHRGRGALRRRARGRPRRLSAGAGLSRGCPGAVSPLRHALLHRRGADRLRPHRQALRARALGPRAGHRRRREVALRRLRAGGERRSSGPRCSTPSSTRWSTR